MYKWGSGDDASNKISMFRIRTSTPETVTFACLKSIGQMSTFWGVIHLVLKKQLKTDQDDWHPRSADFCPLL